MRNLTPRGDSVIQRAVESQDATFAAQALDEIASLLSNTSTNEEERQYLLFSRASCYVLLRDFTNARHALSLALQDCPDSPDTRATFDYFQGLILQAEGKDEEAFRTFSTCLSKHRYTWREWQDVHQDIQARRAFLAVTLGKFEEAIPLLDQVLSFETTQKVKGDALAALGLCYLERKDFSKLLPNGRLQNRIQTSER